MEPESAVTSCYRHPAVESHIRCTRCERHICPDCMRDAAVGFQCVECVQEGAKSVRQARTIVGGRISRTPVVTYTLITLNVLAYLAEVVRPEIVERFSMVAARLVGPDGLYDVYGTPYSADYQADGLVAGEWERLITSAFLHQDPAQGTFGLLHIVMNMLSLWMLGRAVEPMLGRSRYLALYLLSALGGSVFVLLLGDPGQPALGASGAIFGLGAAYYVVARRVGAGMGAVNRFMGFLLLWLLISAGLTSWQGHLGGLLTGGVVALAYAYVPRGPRRALIQVVACAAVLAVLVLAAVVKVGGLK